MRIAAAYIRVSTDDQIEYSPESQLKALRDYAKRNELILPDEYIFMDEGISGRTTTKRPAFNKMIGTAKQKPKPFDVILLWKFSRFARNREDAIVYKSMLRKQLGIEVVSISENVGDDKMSVLIEAMIEAMDEYYSINLAEEVKRGMTEKASRGEPVSIPAFGYDIVNKNYVPNPETAPIIQMIFSDFLGGLGTRELAQKLNALNIRTSRGGLWENRTVEYILRNPVYIGKIRWNTSGKTRRNYDSPTLMIVDGHHEPIIDEATFNAVQEKIDEIKALYGKSTAKQNHPTQPFMLYGLVRCSNCGSTLTRSVSNSVQCYKYSHGKCDISHNISLNKLNLLVLDTLENMLNGTIPPVYSENPQNVENPVGNTASLIAAEKRKLDRVKAAYEAGIDTLEEYKENKQKITERIKILESEQPPAPKKRKPTKQQLAAVEKLRGCELSEEEKNKLIRTIVDYIIFTRSDCSVQIFLK
jgi:DNA invertase Pin-like site-specific DNA recombinase